MSEDKAFGSAQSVRDRLLALSKERQEDFNLTLTRFALERFLYRLSQTCHKHTLVLKGAMLFQVWDGAPHRPTRDLDLLAKGDASPEELARQVKEICEAAVPNDGLVFDTRNLKVEEIRENSRYGGVRTRFEAGLARARIPLQVDFGVGDAVTPEPVETRYPTLLGMENPVVLAYPRETVVAEKLSAICDLGMDNSRMKDYFDLWYIATTFEHDVGLLQEAVERTFERRGQPLPEGTPVGLSDEFARHPHKARQWDAFRSRAVSTGLTLPEVVETVRDFAEPILQSRDLGHGR